MRNITAIAVVAMVLCAATGARAAGEKDRNAVKVKTEAGEQAVKFCQKHDALKAKAEDQRIAIGDKAKDVYKACMAKSGAVTETCVDEARNEVPQLLVDLLASCDPVEGGGVKKDAAATPPKTQPKKKTPKGGGDVEGLPDGKVKPKGVIVDATGIKPPLGQKDTANTLEPELRAKLGYQSGELITSTGKTAEDKSGVTCRPEYKKDCETARDFLIEKGFDTLPDIYPVPETNKKPYGFFVRLGKGRIQPQSPPIIVTVAPSAAPAPTPAPTPAPSATPTPQPAATPAPAPQAQSPAKQPEAKKAEAPVQSAEPKETFPQFASKHASVLARVIAAPRCSFQLGATALHSGVDMLMLPPTPVMTASPLCGIMVDNPYAPFAVYAGPVLNSSFSKSVLGFRTVPFGPGAQAGGEVFFQPMLHFPFTEEQQSWWIADKLFIGGYLHGEIEHTMFKPESITSLRPWEAQYALIKPGVAFRFDWADWGGVIFRTGPTIGLKYAREDGWWQRNMTVFPTLGWTFTVEPFVHMFNTTELIKRGGQE